LSRSGEQHCSSNQPAFVTLFICRAVVGFRICYWQTHSHLSVPDSLSVFSKKWSDWLFLLSTLSYFSPPECSTSAPILYSAIQTWARLILTTFLLRISLYIATRMEFVANHPTLSVLTRSLLDCINGGFYYSGALDQAKAATTLDLRLLPTRKFRVGMYSQEDATCSICFTEYEEGEMLRVLYCRHHAHQQCLDQWLIKSGTCHLCRARADQKPTKGRRRARSENNESCGTNSGAVTSVDRAQTSNYDQLRENGVEIAAPHNATVELELV